MNELLIFACVGVSLVGVVFGQWQGSNLWIEKANSITRKECRGKLYWVIEDGDAEKLSHVAECFDKSN